MCKAEVVVLLENRQYEITGCKLAVILCDFLVYIHCLALVMYRQREWEVRLDPILNINTLIASKF